MTSPAQNFGINMARRREIVGWSQERLAQAMRDLGFKWHQTTVFSVEKGDRKLQLDEAFALATILHVSIDNMTRPPDDRAKTELWVATSGAFRQSYRLLCLAAELYEQRRQALMRFVSEHGDILGSNIRSQVERATEITAAQAITGPVEPWLGVQSPPETAESTSAYISGPSEIERNIAWLESLDRSAEQLRSSATQA